ncbi:hypothetical protein DFH06DRAFT_1183265 [Mycena polygramma]|nr:hypothetical protein DFH06DRAFT_1183265 [Mycena polygramma]
MYSWPPNHRTQPTNRKGYPKNKGKSPVPQYPVLDHGTLGAATLLEENGRLEWAHIIRPKSSNGSVQTSPALLKTGKSVTVFPATRPAPLQMPRMTILHRAEQGANFLRTYVPDIDIAAELIRHELTEDAKVLRQFEDFDPYAGNQLEAIVRPDSDGEKSAFLAFPMGELSRDLNISPLLFSEVSGASFRPSARALRTFDTPIQQISASKPQVPSSQATYLSVRTFGATSLHEIKTSGSDSDPDIRLKEVGSLTSADTGGKQVVDVTLSASPLDMTLVNNQGAVYKYDISNRTRVVRQPTLSASPDPFWRLEMTASADACLLMSKVDLTELDFRTENSSLDLHSAGFNELLTSVEDYQADQMLRLCSTSQVIWIDRRNAAKPLLAFKHGRSFDRSLEVKSIAIENGHLTMLSSRKNGLLTVYDVARSAGTMTGLQTSPYCLTTSVGGGVQKGHNILRHPLEHAFSPVTFFRLSEVGSISAFRLSVGDVGEPSFDWSDDVRRLHALLPLLREEISLLGSPDPETVDMSPAYEHIFQTHRRRSDIDAEEAAESLYDLVEKAPSYWQELNEPVDRILTTYDVLFRSGDEPGDFARADFLAESVLNSTRGYRAVSQGRVSAASLKKDASWDYDLTATLSNFVADFSPDISTITERLRRFDLNFGSECSPSSPRREIEAREQLALDLMLSQHIYSPHPFSTQADINSELETMTRTLSLDDEPPPITFGYLRPIPKDDEQDAQDMIAPGARLLLKDWDIGIDPRDFLYKDPDDEAPEEQVPTPVRRKKTSTELPKERQTADIQRPRPSIIPFDPSRTFLSQEPNFQHRPPPISGSQPASMNVAASGISQEFMASTQVLPGPYGGRPVMKKKIVKKRLGGF